MEINGQVLQKYYFFIATVVALTNHALAQALGCHETLLHWCWAESLLRYRVGDADVEQNHIRRLDIANENFQSKSLQRTCVD